MTEEGDDNYSDDFQETTNRKDQDDNQDLNNRDQDQGQDQDQNDSYSDD